MGTKVSNDTKTPTERFISEFLGGYRYFGFWGQNIGGQHQVWSKEEVVSLIEKYNGVANCGISASTFYDGLPYRLFLPLDFDGEINQSLNDAVKCYNFLVNMNVDMFLSFTGGRGFHIIISLKPNYYSREQVRKFIMFLKNILHLSTLDEQLIDSRRLIRIPGTFHIGKTKHNKRLYKGFLSEIIAMHCGDFLNLNDIVNPDDGCIEIESNGSYPHPDVPLHDYPCVEYHLDTEAEPHHIIRYSYVAWLFANGMSPEAIYRHLKERFSKKWIDWNDRITALQVNHICGKGTYRPLSCESLKSLGYCLGEKCPHFVSFENIKTIREYWKHGEM